MRLRWAACAAVSAIVAVSGAAHSFPSSRLVYARGEGAEACPDEVAIRRAVAERLGYDPFFPSADKTIVAQIAQGDDGLVEGQVELVDERGFVRGLRKFKVAPRQCGELTAAMALAISIAIDPTSSLPRPPAPTRPARPAPPPEEETKRRPPAPRPPPPAPLPAPPLPPPPPAPLARNLHQSEEEGRFTLNPGLAVIGTLGTAPGVALGAALSLSARSGLFSIGVEGRHDLSAAGGVPRVQSSLWAGSLLPCVHPTWIFLCGVGTLGSLRGEGVQVATPLAGRGLYAAMGLRVGLEIPLVDPIVFRPQIDLLVTLARIEMSVDGAPAWRAPPFAAVAGIGLAGHFP